MIRIRQERERHRKCEVLFFSLREKGTCRVSFVFENYLNTHISQHTHVSLPPKGGIVLTAQRLLISSNDRSSMRKSKIKLREL